MTTAQAARISDGGADVERPGALENDLTQGVDELSERQGLDEGLKPVGKAAGREENAREQPHRQHDQVHQAR